MGRWKPHQAKVMNKNCPGGTLQAPGLESLHPRMWRSSIPTISWPPLRLALPDLIRTALPSHGSRWDLHGRFLSQTGPGVQSIKDANPCGGGLPRRANDFSAACAHGVRLLNGSRFACLASGQMLTLACVILKRLRFRARFRGGLGEWFHQWWPTWMNPIRSFLAQRSNSLDVPLYLHPGLVSGEFSGLQTVILKLEGAVLELDL